MHSWTRSKDSPLVELQVFVKIASNFRSDRETYSKLMALGPAMEVNPSNKEMARKRVAEAPELQKADVMAVHRQAVSTHTQMPTFVIRENAELADLASLHAMDLFTNNFGKAAFNAKSLLQSHPVWEERRFGFYFYYLL